MFIGRKLSELPKMDMRNVEIVLVSGAPPNFCEHVLLCVRESNYFHFDGPSPIDYPKYLHEFEYRAYLKQSKKKEIGRKQLDLPCPQGAENKLLQLMHNKWATLLISHNCASFVAEIIHAGGNFWSVPQHCPRTDMAIQMFMDKLLPNRGTDRLMKDFICQ